MRNAPSTHAPRVLALAGMLIGALLAVGCAQQAAPGRGAQGGAALAMTLSVVGVAPANPGQARDGDLRAGAAAVEITPPRHLWNTMMAGYSNPKRLPQGVHDPLYAKALVLDNGQTRVCIVTTDLFSVPINLRESVLARLPREAGLTPERILICASHTHSGPGGLADDESAERSAGEFQPALADFVAGKIAGAVNDAAAGLRPAKWGYASAEVSGFVHNRRGSKTTDAQVGVLRVDGADDEPIALLVNFGTHPVFLGEDNCEFSADFVGYMLAAVEQTRGGVAMFANGTLGDQGPDQPGNIEGASARAAHFAERMAEQALRTAGRAHTRRQAALASILGSMRLAAPMGSTGTRSAPVMAMRISDILLLGVPGKPTAEIGLEIKRRARQFAFDLPMIVGLANDDIGCILPREDYEQGGYEAEMSFFGPALGLVMVEAMTNLASRIQPMAAAHTALRLPGSGLVGCCARRSRTVETL